MCGISGFLGRPALPDGAGALLGRMIGAIAHRGPDGCGSFLGEGVGLAHARLSIIDPAGGAQPMTDETGEVAITFNGEVFNHVELRRDLIARGARFRTGSDTEVILQLYLQRGVDCVDELNGDFAFAIWDGRRGRLMLARDRMGVRPLSYARHGGTLYFASEVKGLLAVPGMRAELDPVALDEIFSLWFTLPPRTAFKGVSELPPGHMLLADRDGMAVRRWWRLGFPDRGEEPEPASEDALAEELGALLEDAVRIRLRADVPVGAYLSGGLDSAIVAALARRVLPGRLGTFSIAFDEAEFDESAQQREMVTALGTAHRAQRCTASDIAAAFPAVVRHAERPVLRTAPAPMLDLSALVRRSGMKVVLTGEGADEVFAGYDIFKEAKLRAFWGRQPDSRARPMLFRRLYPWLPALQAQSPAYLRAFFGTGLDRRDDPLFSHLPRLATAAAAKFVYSGALRDMLAGHDAAEAWRADLPDDFKRWHPLHQSQYLEGAYLLPGYILSAQGDRVAMANAVEARFPFLDHRVVEFAARIPPRLKLRGLREKHILRRAAAKLLPAGILDRPKQPYRAPEAGSFFGPRAPAYVGAVLSRGAIEAAGWFDAQAVERLARKAGTVGLAGFRDNQALLGVLSTQLWHRTFAPAASAAPQVARIGVNA